MCLQGVGKHNLPNLELKRLNILLLLILSLLLPIRGNASFNDNIMIIMKFSLFLHLPTLKDLEQLYITQEIFVLLLGDFTFELA